MHRLVIHPNFRRWGVATALVKEVEKRFRREDVKRISSLVEKENDYTVSFWESVGYDFDPRISRYI